MDVLVWGSGSGSVVLENNDNGVSFSNSVLKITGLTPSDISYSHVGGNLVFTSPTGDTLVISNVPLVGNPFHIQYFEQTGDWYGDNTAQTFDGVAGQSDNLVGNGGDDVYRWGVASGNDTINNWESDLVSQDVIEIVGLTPAEVELIGEGGDLILKAPSGETLTVLNHVADSYSAINEIRFEDGTVWSQADIIAQAVVYRDGTAADETVSGSNTNDVIDGKGGNDTLIGYEGDDTYVWGSGSGSDIVQNWESDYSGTDRVLVHNLNPDDVQFVIEGRDLVLISNTGDTLRVLNHVADSYSAVNEIEFADGTVLDLEAIEALATTSYSWGDGQGHVELENYEGNGFSDNILIITGLEPSEVSYSHVDGNLIFTSPAGDMLVIHDVPFVGNPFHIQYFEQTGDWYGDNTAQMFEGISDQSDHFAGNGGDDIYKWGENSGNDTINNWESDKLSHDVIEIVGFDPADIELVGEGRDLILKASSGETLTVLNHVADSFSAIDEIRFEDGTVWTQADIIALATVFRDGTAADETVAGSVTNDVIDGKGGNDILIGYDGDDTYIWGTSSGNDVINNWESGLVGNDVVQIVGISPSDIELIGEGRDLVIKGPSGETLRVLDHIADSHSAVNEIHFDDGTVWTQADILEQYVVYQDGTFFGDTIIGGDTNDIINAKGGDDLVFAGEGNDSVYGGAGADIVTGGDGDDLIKGGRGNDTLRGSDGNDILHGELGLDALLGGEGDDWLLGGHGSDVLQGGKGSDTLIGDSISGGSGQDTFIWSEGDEGVVGTPAVDNIKDFSIADDILDLSDLLVGEDVDNLDNYLSLSFGSENTIISINTDGQLNSSGADQVIVLENLDLQSDVSGQLLLQNTILTDE